MNGGTFTLPSGTKVRSQSQRRFVVVTEYVPGKARIQYRTDDYRRAIDSLVRYGPSATVVDTVGRRVRVGPPRSFCRAGEVQWVDA